MLLEGPTTRTEYPASISACETLGGPFVVGTGGALLSYVSKPTFWIS